MTTRQPIAHLHEEADLLLARIARAQADVARTEGFVAEEIQAVKAKWGDALAAYQAELKGASAALVRLMKGNKGDLFDASDRVALGNGVLIYAKGSKVKVPKGALEAIEAQGWLEAVKVVKSVDRDVVAAWPVERLVVIGAERQAVETFAYELAVEKVRP